MPQNNTSNSKAKRVKETHLKGLDNGQFRLKGEMSFRSVPDLWKRFQQLLTEVEATTLEIDLKGVNHVDSAGLALVVAWTRVSQRNAKAIRFANIPAKLKALAKANNLDELLDLH